MGYIHKHWRGELSLGVSYWVNFTLLSHILNLLAALGGFAGKNLIISSLFYFISAIRSLVSFCVSVVFMKAIPQLPAMGGGFDPFTDNPVILSQVALLFTAILLFIVLPWQAIGVWRSGTNHIKRYGKRFWAITAKVIIVCVLASTVNQGVHHWANYCELFKTGFLKDDLGSYALRLYADNTVLYLNGELPFGTAKDVANVLHKNPGVKKLILDSNGGRIYEGRQLAKLVMDHGLDTCTMNQCRSAAVLPFAAGKQRYLCKDAKLNFCQYLYPENAASHFDIQKEYEKDTTFYRSRGVSRSFVKRIFNTKADDYWTPKEQELIDSGMIHSVIPVSEAMPMEDAIVAGFDTPRISSAISSGCKATADEVKGWIWGCSGVLWERNRDGFISLGSWKNSEQAKAEKKELLSEGWDIKNRSDLLRDIFWLSQGGGHRDDFARDGRFVCKMSKEQLDAFLKPYKDYPERCNDFRVAHQYYTPLGDKGIIGWDLCRYMCLCRWGYICGWLDEETTWKLMIPVARELQQTFSSWEELGQNYLIGRHYWSLRHVREDKKYYDEAFQRLIEMPSSPWNKYTWNLDLSRACELISDSLKAEQVSLETGQFVRAESEDFPSVPAIDFPELPSPDFSKVNTLSELQQAGSVLTVPDDYPTIQAAINATKEGDTVFIKEGVYDEWILADGKNRIRVVGQNTEKVVLHLTDPKQYEVFKVQNGNGMVISDLTVENIQKDPNSMKTGIGVSNGSADILRCRIINHQGNGVSYYSAAQGKISDCRIESCAFSGILATEKGTELKIFSCYIGENKNRGIIVYGDAKMIIENTIITKNNVGLAILGAGTNALVSNCRIYDSRDTGIVIYNAAVAKIEDTLCELSKKPGVYILDDKTQVECIRLYSLRNSGCGICVEKGASAKLDNSIFSENKESGIWIRGAMTRATLKEVQCYKNGMLGICVGGNANATIEDSICRENKDKGICFFEKGKGVARKCVTKDNGGGIYVADGASAEIEENICEYNVENGIAIYQEGASATLKGNRCSRNGKIGISVSGGASGTITDSLCENNGLDGIEIYEKNTRAELNNNRCLKNRRGGISFSVGASGTVENCFCADNYESGIVIYQKNSQATLKNNECRGNKYNGITIEDGAGSEISLMGNVCSGNYPSGIHLETNIAGQISKNECQDNPWAGIVVDGNSVCPIIDDNICSQNGTWGILILNGANPTLKENVVEQNGKGTVSEKRIAVD
jgi:parallel beta-helix repeat protein